MTTTAVGVIVIVTITVACIAIITAIGGGGVIGMMSEKHINIASTTVTMTGGNF